MNGLHRLFRALRNRERPTHLAAGRRVKCGARGTTDRSILIDYTRNGIERRYHATKGWRVKRVATA